MKLKNISAATCAIILLMLFLPVFYCLIFLGTNMNYNEIHKIVTVEGNKVLLLCAVIGAIIFCLIYILLRKIPYNRHTVIGVAVSTLLICILLYIINTHISKCIAFYGGWDCGMVSDSAQWLYEGKGLGHGDYYNIWTNNIPITWILYKLYSFAKGFSNYPYNPEFIWIQFQCVMFSASVFFTVMGVLLTSRKIGVSILTLLINSLFLGLSPWKIIPYTDGSTVAIPVFIIFLYILFLHLKSKWRYTLWFLMAFSGVLGGIFKATCYVPLIAILLIDFTWGMFEKDPFLPKLKRAVFKIGLFLCGYFLAVCCKYNMYKTLNFQYDYDMEIGWRNYLYLGLNEESTGAGSGDGLNLLQTYWVYPRNIRNKYEMEFIVERIQAKGFRGLLDFWLRKQVMNFNDGTFSWFQEGFFNAWEYEDITDSSWKKPLREFYWEDGKNYIWFSTLSQGIWIFILAGIIAEAVLLLINSIIRFRKPAENTEGDSLDMCIRTIRIVIFIGTFLFVMLFEGRARYLFNITPVFVAMAVAGYCEFADMFCRFESKFSFRKNSFINNSIGNASNDKLP